MSRIAIRLLGPFELRIDDQPVEVSSLKQRSILAVLALRPGLPATVAEIIDAVWGADAGDRADHTLQQHISATRKLLEPDRRPRAESTVLLRRGPGYQLDAVEVDVTQFDARTADARRHLQESQLDDAVRLLDESLALWRGDALTDLRDTSWFQAVAVQLDERRLTAIEDRAEALLDRGSYQRVIPELEALAQAHPFRERLHAQLMLALYGVDRQADALAAYRRLRQALIDQLGLEPSPPVRALEAAILAQDESLSPKAKDIVASVTHTFRESQARHTALQLPDGQLVVIRPGTMLMGRAAETQVRLSDSRVSRVHAEVWSDGRVHRLRDLESTNGTTVNGETVIEKQLAEADIVSLGGVELVVVGIEPGAVQN